MKHLFSALLLGFVCCAVNAAKVADTWTVFGPYWKLDYTLPKALSAGIPDNLRIASSPRKAIAFKHENGKADLQKIYKKPVPRRSFYICIPIESAKGEKFRFGAGADWWMDIYLNGKPVGDTLAEGNITHPPTGSDHIFTVDLKPGKNYLVIGVTGGVGTQQLVFAVNPKAKAGKRSAVSKVHLGKEQLPPLEKFVSAWKNGSGKNAFKANEITYSDSMLHLNAKVTANNIKRYSVKLHLEPGKQYCFNWGALTRKGTQPIFLIQERPDGGKVYFARELANGRNRTGYFYAENPEPYAVLEVHGNAMTDFNKLSLRRRIDRNAAFQDWRLQRFPAAREMTSLSRKIATPHFDQASRLAGGTLNLFCIGTFWGQRDQIELEQRFDVKCDGIFTNGNAGLPPRYWTRNAAGNTILKDESAGISRAAKADCIVIDNCGASALSVPMRKKIMEEVKRGAGLVICAFDQPYYPYKDGRGKAAVAKMRSVFAQIFDNPEKADTGFVRISAAGKLDAEFGRYGKGRAVLLKSADNVKGKDRICFEIRSGLIGKSVLWATKRLPQVRLNAKVENGKISAEVSGAVKNATLNALVSDMLCREKSTEKIALKSGKNTFKKAIDEFGTFPVVITSEQDGISQDWDIIFAEKKSSGLLKDVSLKTHAPMIRCLVTLNRKPQKGEMLEVSIVDYKGNKWIEKRQYARHKTTIYVKAENFPVMAGDLSVSLLSPDGKVLDKKTQRVVLNNFAKQDPSEFNLGVWGAPVNNYSAKLFYEILRDEYDLQFMLSGNHIPQTWEMLDMGILSSPNAVPGQIDFARNNKVKGNADAPERELCLSSPKLKNLLVNRLNLLYRTRKHLPARYYFGDHETNLLGYINKAKPGTDYCFSPTCTASLHELLKKDYGTLDKLNASWGSNFTAWKDVTPIVLKNAVKNGQAARWIDHRRNMDKVWTDLTAFRIKALRKINPHAVWYVQNLHSSYTSNDSFSGIDFEQLFNCDLGAGAMPESYINAFTKKENRFANSQGGSMWPPSGGLVDDPELASIRTSRVIWQAMLLGQRNCLYYLHNWINHGSILFCDIFMVYPDLTISQEGKALAQAMKTAHQGIDKLILGSKTDDSGIAMLYSRASEHACTYWQAFHKNTMPETLNPRYQQFEFFVPAIDASSRGFSSIASKMLQAGALKENNTRLLILPFVQSIPPQDAKVIREFVKNGGTVIADFRPAVSDGHGSFAKSGLLDDVFGIKQNTNWNFKVRKANVIINYNGSRLNLKNALVGDSFKVTTAKVFGKAGNTPVMLENTCGKGKAILLNFTTQDEKFHGFFGKMLSALNIPELFSCKNVSTRYATSGGMVNASQIRKDTTGTAAALDKSATEDAGERETLVYENSTRPKFHRYTNGPAEIIGYYACRRGFAMGHGEMTLNFNIRKAGHVYDLINGKYLGNISKWQVTMPLEGVALYGVLPFKAQAPQVKVAGIKRMPNGYYELKVEIKLSKEAAGINYPVRLTFTAPDGKKWNMLSRTVSVKNSEATAVIPLPGNAPQGTWKISAREVFGGTTTRFFSR
ncbi:MAG: hypothetical protein E7044_11735 [Lentisphaerae bacterium]|nr:hypothetical protein [Lentisphaerota bacterium]